MKSNRVAGNVPARWKGSAVLKDQLDYENLLNCRMPEGKSGGMVPGDDGESPLVWIQIGQRYRIFHLSFVLTGILCRDCPSRISYVQTGLLDRALVWIADHEEAEHRGGNVRDPR